MCELFERSLSYERPTRGLPTFDRVIDLRSIFQEMEFVSEFFDMPNKFQILVASLCPSIYGHEIIKASLLLGLVGGCQRCADDPR